MAADAPNPVPSPRAQPVVVGANHKSSTSAVRDRLSMEDGAVPGFLEGLRGAGLSQALVLSTCDRTEVIAVDRAPEAAAEIIFSGLADFFGLAREKLTGQLYFLQGEEALEHVFAVAASLDSLVIGEPQVLGQVKASHRLARDAGMVGAELDHIMQAAFAAAKRVRFETTVGENAVSIAAAAVRIAREVHGDLRRSAALMIGAGEMGELVAGKLREAGLARLAVADPVNARAESMARRLGCHVVGFDTLVAALADADILMSAVGGGGYLITAEMVRSALRRRKLRPMFLVDAAIPGDIEPAVNRLDEAFLYDLNDLEGIATEGRASREAAASEARDIVREEVAAFRRGEAARAGVPALSALRRHFEEVRAQVLADHPRASADEITRLLVNRLLHAPSEALRSIAARDGAAAGDGAGGRVKEGSGAARESAAVERMLRRLFSLDEPLEAPRPNSESEEESE
ncbi:MAG: glutamyl-tRNA reductase [Alphaproteobacteria bacterium]